MSWRAAIGLAARSMVRRPGRAVLTVLAVLLAAALLTALLTIAGTAETRVLDELAKGGPLAGIKVAAATPDPAQVGQDNAQPGDPKALDQGALDEIAALPNVNDVVPIISTRMFVIPPAPPAGAKAVDPFLDTVVGVDMTQVPLLPVSVIQGRLPAPGALTEVAVGEGYLSRFGLDRTQAAEVVGTELRFAAPQATSVGGQVVVRGRWFKAVVVGVVAQEAADGQFLVPAEQVDLARGWTSQGIDDPNLGLQDSPYSGLYVVADNLDDVGTVRNEITAVGYSTSAPENLIAAVRRYLRVVEIVLTSVGTIALVVAALGITNAMLAAVRERRREIGVLKAIGARDGDVMRLFLVEAAVLGLTGGVLGAIAGWFVARAVASVVNSYLVDQGLTPVTLVVPWTVLAGTIVGSTLLAIGAGTLPALRAARLPAREAVGAA